MRILTGIALLALRAAAATDTLDPGAPHFSALGQITPLNVGKLGRVWVYHTGEKTGPFEMVPLVASGLLYFTSQSILSTQIVVKGQRTAWCQQYDMLNLTLAGARNYEPPSISSGESASLLLFLMKLPRPNKAVTEAVNSAAAWLRQVAVYGKAFQRGANGRMLIPTEGAGHLWSRYYEIGTNRPIFGDRDKTIHDDVNEISLERRNGYSWWNAGPKAALERYTEWSATSGVQ